MKRRPGHRLDVDVRLVTPFSGSLKMHCEFTASDDWIPLRVLRISPPDATRSPPASSNHV